MKEIQSAGGPLIGLDLNHVDLWSGIFGKSFIERSEEIKSDYEFAGYLTDGRAFPPCVLSKIDGASASGVLIAEPNPTALLQIDRDAIYIVQIECCEPEWDLGCITKGDFQSALFESENSIPIYCQSGRYVIFDSAYRGKDYRKECLTFDLDRGYHNISYAHFVKDELTELILLKIERLNE